MAFSALALAWEGVALGIVEASSVTNDLLPNRSAPLLVWLGNLVPKVQTSQQCLWSL